MPFFQQQTPRDHEAKHFQQLQNMVSKILILIAVAQAFKARIATQGELEERLALKGTSWSVE